MKTLLIGKVWPEPASTAAGRRSMDILDALAAVGWELHFASAAQASTLSERLEPERGIPCHAIAINNSQFDSWIQALAPEVVIFDRFMTEEQFGWRVQAVLPEALRVLDTSDLHCLRAARQEALKSGGEPDLYNDLALREIASIHRCDLTLMISEYECELLQSCYGIDPGQYLYWPFLLDPPLPDTPVLERRRDCVMIGSFLHEPNWDAARWCRSAIWPLVRQAMPEVEVHIYGSYPPAKAFQLDAPRLGFRINGRADDALSTLSRYKLNLAPLRFGAGLKGKLADAFRAGTPSIATPVAVEGMNGSLPWGSPICEEPEAFAKALVELYQSPNSWQHAQACGFRIARERFERSVWMPRLPERLQAAFAQRHAHRHRRFVGRLLWHHQRRSSEYMSRWIEAKKCAQNVDPTKRDQSSILDGST